MDGGAVSCPCADCLSGRAPRQPPNPTMSDTYVMQLHRDHATAVREDRAPEPGPVPLLAKSSNCIFVNNIRINW